MKVILFTLVMFLSKAFGGDDDGKGVHFKIHVPEIIKHHIHTKTVFIHVHELKPNDDYRKPNEESHVEDWTSYNSYNYNGGLEENGGGYHRKQKKVMVPYDDYMPIREDDYQPFVSPYAYDPPADNLLSNEPPMQNENYLGYFGPPADHEDIIDQRAPNINAKVYPPKPHPPQYAIHEEVDEEGPANGIDYKNAHESGYRRGMNSETGQIIHKDIKDFYDKENEEEDFAKGGFENDSYSKYAGNGYHGNYDKEIGLEQRSGKKRADRRYLVARMVIR